MVTHRFDIVLSEIEDADHMPAASTRPQASATKHDDVKHPSADGTPSSAPRERLDACAQHQPSHDGITTLAFLALMLEFHQRIDGAEQQRIVIQEIEEPDRDPKRA
ncbi:MAG TPA: hypothetical protein VNV25_02250 [Gemmatimonadaceae bacterium]|nr:hypothetical protein [Gemmatimonadaceae bacterium]